MVDLIDDDYPDSALTARWKQAISWTDVVIGAAPPENSAATDTAAVFNRAEIAELTLTVAVAQGFSKAAIVWGPEPQLPTTEIPTPA